MHLPKEETEGSFSSAGTQTEITLGRYRQKIKPEGEIPYSIPGDSDDSEKKDVEVKANEIDDPLQHRLDPKSREDFRSLYEETEQWRDCRLRDIESCHDLSLETKKEKRAFVLSEEMKLLCKIDSMKREVLQDVSKRKFESRLVTMSEEEIWELSSGEKILVETESSNYKRKLVGLYNQLSHFGDQEG